MRTISAFVSGVLLLAACPLVAAADAAPRVAQATSERRAGQAAPAVQATTGQPTPPQATTAGNAENGKLLFMKKNCYYCHGTAGQGGRDGARISNVALTTQQLIRYVRQPAGSMPAYGEPIISEQELTDIYAFLKSLPPAKPAKDVPLLDQLR